MLAAAYLESLMQVLSKFGTVDPGLRLAISRVFITLELRKGQTLLFKNEVPKNCWFLYEGTARETQNTDGIEKTIWFWFKGDFIFLNPGFFTQHASQYNLEIVEPSIMFSMSYEQLMTIRQEFPAFDQIIEGIREHHFSTLREHVAQLKACTAQERFDFFYASHKRLFNLLPVKYIADFLSIHPHNFWRYLR